MDNVSVSLKNPLSAPAYGTVRPPFIIHAAQEPILYKVFYGIIVRWLQSADMNEHIVASLIMDELVRNFSWCRFDIASNCNARLLTFCNLKIYK